jgi:hypothetical protein
MAAENRMPDNLNQVRAHFLACIPQAIEAHWDTVYAPRLAGFPVNIVYAARAEGDGLRHGTYVFDPSMSVENDQSPQMRYRSSVKSDFSVLVVLHREGRMKTFKYCGPELICEACGQISAQL